ncbi:MAG: MlaA family lipoprotein [Caulobacteraceae bacterium]
MSRRSTLLVLVASLAALAPFAAQAASPGDPWEGFNRKIFIVSAVLDKLIVGPLSKLYRAVTPGPIGKGLHNLIVNLSEPVVIANDVLQFRPRRAIAASVRLGINTTLGVGGLIDVTAKHDPHHDNGFADTLGHYGVRPGPYLFFPFIGPSSVRDLFGTAVDAVSDPLHIVNYPYRSQVSLARTSVGALDQRAAAQDQLEGILSGAADPYATLRSVYLQQRQSEITGAEAIPALPDIEATPAAPLKPPPAPDNLPPE